MKLLFASQNEHKLLEMQRIFPGYEVTIPARLGIEFDYEELGTSFLENSLGKARALLENKRIKFSDEEEVAIIADDSGICVDALGGAPGIFSARYGSENGKILTSEQRNALLLERVGDEKNRACRFVCCMCLILDDYRVFTAQEILEGTLIREGRGAGGFGYDPVVYLEQWGKTVAELSDREKDIVSHRGKAGRAIFTILNSR